VLFATKGIKLLGEHQMGKGGRVKIKAQQSLRFLIKPL
jgi:hypothetical protein